MKYFLRPAIAMLKWNKTLKKKDKAEAEEK